MFEFDPGKSLANKAKHGIDFDEAQALWRDPQAIRILSNQRHIGEQRWLVIARIDRQTWTAIGTDRDNALRIISVRRARENEEAAYGQARED